MNDKKVGLVTVLYNCTEVLNDFLNSISLQKYGNYILYLVDNSSDKQVLTHAVALSKKLDLNIKIIDNNGENVGVAKGNNQGIKQALRDGCDIIGLVNNDLIFNDRDIFSKLVKSLEIDSIVSPKIRSYPDKSIWYEGGYFDMNRGTTPHKISKNGALLPYAPTCFLWLNKEVFETVGYMDEWYFAYYDDSDFVYRSLKKGFTLFVSKEAEIYHKVSSSTGGPQSDFCIYYGNRNRIYFIRKNIKKLMPLFFTVLSRFVILRNLKLKQSKLLIKAVCDGFRKEI
ncbi:glycosyltransferase family 2 protein [Vibrio nigripulchritudo]|uniref:glycosyltransferase family 2 protein n=1 Tax=Vibrio nigripulchritudo TaxID=28173 RepID=UPI0005FA10F7|nr:glycosyltransferase family 2 protein [Vibrio nigripulchritudo]KJY79060.1 glycosyl transferase [Vibrio nigripulchritudo]